jgi:hypothetical protein
MARTIRKDQDQAGHHARCAATGELREARVLERQAAYSPSRAGDLLRRAREVRALAARRLVGQEARP